MKKLAELNFEIENVLGLNIEFNASVQNFKYNGFWVTDIPTSYFKKKEKKLDKLFNKNINYNEKSNVLFLKQIHKDVSEVYEYLLKKKYDEFESFINNKDDWNYDLNYPDKPPAKLVSDVSLPNPANDFDDRQEYIESFVGDFTKLYIEYNNENDDRLEEVNNEGMTEKKKEFLDQLKMIYSGNENKKDEISEYEEELIYAKAHLSYIISLHMELVRRVGLNLNKVLSVINRIDSYTEDEIGEPIYEISSQDENLKFDLSKINLGYLFYNLYEIGIIAKDKSDIKDERTKLKNYLNCANLYYLDNKKYAKVQKMTRGMPVTRNTESKVVNSEIVFLESLTSKLNNRINELKLTLKNLIKRGH